jgi:histidinol-phosphate phosphatase family protein
MKNKGVFIDRDGTLNRDVPYCSRPQDFELLPGAGESLRLLKAAGFKIIVVTNQSGIARGYFTKETLELIHNKMRSDLAGYGAGVDAVYYCPHHPNDGCDCRKPEPKMVLEAAKDLNIDLSQSYVIGDDKKDVEMGIRAGCRKSLRINSNMLPDTENETFSSFLRAVHWLIDYDKKNII